MIAKTEASDIRFRPHFKTHQNKKIAHLFREKGVDAITVSSLKMAEFFAADGWSDITIAIPTDLNELAGIEALARKISLTLIVDNAAHLEGLKKLKTSVNVMIEVDNGYGRSGIFVRKHRQIFDLIRQIKEETGLRFSGLLTHFGNTYKATSREEIKEIALDSLRDFSTLRNYLEPLTGEKIFISAGDTPSASVLDRFEGIDELRPGNFVFYDLMQLGAGSCDLSQIAVVMRCPVISKNAARKQLIIHGGAVHFSKESIVFEGAESYGRAVDVSSENFKLLSANLISLSQEHGIVQCNAREFERFRIGDYIHIIPVHSCLTANLMKEDLIFVDKRK